MSRLASYVLSSGIGLLMTTETLERPSSLGSALGNWIAVTSGAAGHWEAVIDTGYAEFVRESLRAIASLRTGWDGYGAAPIGPDLIDTARDLLNRLPDYRVDNPAIIPTADSSIQLEWTIGRRSLEIEIVGDGVARYLRWSPGEGIEDEADFEISDATTMRRVLNWLSQG
jgi:hypothetical protein